jgi:multimeric flavodoxin WrbA
MGRMLAEKVGGRHSEIREFFLPKDFGEFCCGCTQCFMISEKLCPHYEKLRPITAAMDSADLLIFTTPVYVYHCTGSMKAFLDHYGWRWMIHRPEKSMFKKQAVVLTTAAAAGMKPACKDVTDSFHFWGIGKYYSYGAAVKATAWKDVKPAVKKKINRNLDMLAAEIKENYGNVIPSIKTRAFFELNAHVMRGISPADKAYWKKNGWTKGIRPW